VELQLELHAVSRGGGHSTNNLSAAVSIEPGLEMSAISVKFVIWALNVSSSQVLHPQGQLWVRAGIEICERRIAA
jgi:hypothetical protein